MTRWVALLAVLLGNVVILSSFADRSWWPPDEGPYVHVAERVLDGELLHRDVRDFHTDYAHAVHAAAFALLGRDVASLRVPLAVIATAQSLLAFALLLPRGPLLAACAALALTSLGFVQFPNPTPNWYALALTLLAAACLQSGRRWSLLATGACVGAIFGFRQVTGVLVGVGAVAWMLAAARDDSRGIDTAMARGVIALAAAGLAVYLLQSTDTAGWLMLGFWPLAALLWCALAAETSNAATARVLVRAGSGFIAALAPMLVYHAWHANLAGLWNDAVLGALAVPRLWYIPLSSYADIGAAALDLLGAPSSLAAASNALYWLALLSAGAISGALLLKRLAETDAQDRSALALPFIASFHALVSLFNQIPVYLYYSVGLSLVALASQLRGARARAGLALALVWIAGTAVLHHAGQPLTRSLARTLSGERVPLVPNDRFGRASLWMESRDVAVFNALVDEIQRRTERDQRILVLPNDAELYFLAQRSSAVDFWNAALVLRSADAVAALAARLREQPPALVVYARSDKVTTALLEPLIRELRERYAAVRRIGRFEVYVPHHAVREHEAPAAIRSGE